MGPDGLLHKADGTVIDPSDGQIVKDNNVFAQKEYFDEIVERNEEAASERLVRKTQRQKVERMIGADGLIHQQNGKVIDPMDGHEVTIDEAEV